MPVAENHPLILEQNFGTEKRPPVRPARFAARESGACALPNEGALKLRKHAEHVEDEDALRGSRVDRLLEAPEADVAQAQLLDRLDELLHGSRQAVELLTINVSPLRSSRAPRVGQGDL